MAEMSDEQKLARLNEITEKGVSFGVMLNDPEMASDLENSDTLMRGCSRFSDHFRRLSDHVNGFVKPRKGGCAVQSVSGLKYDLVVTVADHSLAEAYATVAKRELPEYSFTILSRPAGSA